MAFCANCGFKVQEYDKFCPRCGVATRKDYFSDTNNNSVRKESYDGEIKKCPNCGEPLNSFKPFCASCGFEIRNTSASNSVQELARKIQEIESQRTTEKGNNAIIEKRLTNVIGSFPIPNTKEDILEFMILASSNIENSNAWIPKVEQTYLKASNSLRDTDDFQKIEQLYRECKRNIKKNKRRKETRGLKKATKIILIIVISHIAFFAFMFLMLYIGAGGTASQKNEAEEKRLNAIVQEVDDALDNHDYKLAMRIVESMKYQTYDKERERWWGIKKESMIDEIISEAHKNGVEIERPSDTSITIPTEHTNPKTARAY